MQRNLLRVLQEREIKPVGSASCTQVDVRVLAATNEDMEAAMKDGRIRRDLYYRLAVVTIQIPPLRMRTDDIVPLAYHFMHKYAAAYQKNLTHLTSGALQAITENPWPGNVRELENVMERAVLLSTPPHIDESNLSFPIPIDDGSPDIRRQESAHTYKETIREHARESGKQALIDALKKTNGNKSKAAKLLGIGRTSLYQKMKALGLE
jgi:transcriptional regulator with PAS, ATPase and Fis domain